MTFDVEQRIYRISQDHETMRVVFMVYGRVEKDLGVFPNILSHEELHGKLLELVHEYQEKLRESE